MGSLVATERLSSAQGDTDIVEVTRGGGRSALASPCPSPSNLLLGRPRWWDSLGYAAPWATAEQSKGSDGS